MRAIRTGLISHACPSFFLYLGACTLLVSYNISVPIHMPSESLAVSPLHNPLIIHTCLLMVFLLFSIAATLSESFQSFFRSLALPPLTPLFEYSYPSNCLSRCPLRIVGKESSCIVLPFICNTKRYIFRNYNNHIYLRHTLLEWF